MTRTAVLVTVDALRRDHVQSYVDGPVDTTAIDNFAADATQLESFWSGGCVTGRSFRTVFSGSADFSRGRRNVTYPSGPSLPAFVPDDVTTIAISSNATVSRAGGWSHNWDEFHDFRSDESDAPGSEFGLASLKNRVNTLLDHAPTRFHEWVQTAYRYYNLRSKSLPFPRADDVAERTATVLERVDGPLLLWVHLMEPHTPWLPIEAPTDYGSYRVARAHGRMEVAQQYLSEPQKSLLQDLYAQRVGVLSRAVGELLDLLSFHNRYDESLVWLFADHGEELGENGWFGHGHMGAPRHLPPALTHVPGFIRTPGVDVDGSRVCGHLDVAPTVGQWFDATVPDCDGESLLSPPSETHCAWSISDDLPERDCQTVACITDEWRFVRRRLNGEVKDSLYERTDTAATADISASNPDVVADFDERVSDRLPEYKSEKTDPIDEDIQQRLRDLGYR